MNGEDLIALGFPQGPVIGSLLSACKQAERLGWAEPDIIHCVHRLKSYPEEFGDHDSVFGAAAKKFKAEIERQQRIEEERKAATATPVPFKIWGDDHDDETKAQMIAACRLPIAVGGALMPDGHVGYGLPIGGVFAADNAVIPYGVGMDIACRMMLTVLPGRFDPDRGPKHNPIDRNEDRYVKAIKKCTRFGVGSNFGRSGRRNHAVMDEDWNIGQELPRHKDMAWEQLGSSGGGNHFCDIGEITFERQTTFEQLPGIPDVVVDPGTYVAIMTHSGSRGVGGKMCQFYSSLARLEHQGLPKEQQNLAWLDLDSELGEEYWRIMELMGRYASANHHLIHEAILKELSSPEMVQVENHHNFAWKEIWGGKTVVVHRKGATPASYGTDGIIPGSMATPAFLVRGRGNKDSFNSCSHGAGRAMSRKQTKAKYEWSQVEDLLRRKRVKLISAGLDEVPGGYKKIEKVMAAQQDLVDVLARFEPRIVKMAGTREGQREDRRRHKHRKGKEKRE